MKLSFIAYFISGFVFVACNNGTHKDEKTTSDTANTKQSESTNTLQNDKNAYLIEPPDTSYTGEYLDKYPNSNTKFKGYFRFGKRHGQWMAFYANGTLWSECFYDKGLKHGQNNVYYENGKLRYSGIFKNDLREGVWTYYDEFGAELKRIMFKNDVEVPSN